MVLMNDVLKITERHELVELARTLRVRDDWHEPDEQELTARVFGDNFDNAMGPGYWYGSGDDKHCELTVELRRRTYDDHGEPVEGEAIAQINLATLLAWASESTPSVDEAARDRYIRRVALRDAAATLLEMSNGD